jgi:hypothetical protein
LMNAVYDRVFSNLRLQLYMIQFAYINITGRLQDKACPYCSL